MNIPAIVHSIEANVGHAASVGIGAWIVALLVIGIILYVDRVVWR